MSELAAQLDRLAGDERWADLVEQHRRSGVVHGLPDGAQIPLVQSALACDFADGFLTRREGMAFDERGGGNSATQYCSTDLTSTNVRPYQVIEFLQH